MFLFRGVSKEMHLSGVALKPKGNAAVAHAFYGKAKYGSGETYGASSSNAIIAHQRSSNEFPSAYVSTTPHETRARYYATKNGTQSGFVYKLKRRRLKEFKICEYPACEHATWPQIPEDDEVLLIAHDRGAIPQDLVIDIQEV